jgi:hypothetical protein
VEEDHEFGKDQFGFDQSQARLFMPIMRHITLVMAALAVCAVTAAGARADTHHPPTPTSPHQQPPPDPGLIALTVTEVKRLYNLATRALRRAGSPTRHPPHASRLQPTPGTPPKPDSGRLRGHLTACCHGTKEEYPRRCPLGGTRRKCLLVRSCSTRCAGTALNGSDVSRPPPTGPPPSFALHRDYQAPCIDGQAIATYKTATPPANAPHKPIIRRPHAFQRLMSHVLEHRNAIVSGLIAIFRCRSIVLVGLSVRAAR